MQDAYSKINNLCLVILTGIAITIALIYTRVVLVPFVFSVFIYAVASPLVNWLHDRLKLPQIAAVGLTFFIFLIVASFIFFIVSSSLGTFFESDHLYRGQIVEFIRWGSTLIEKWGVQVDEATIQGAVKKLEIFQFAKNVTSGAVSLLGNAALVTVFVFFLLAGGGTGRKKNKLVTEIHGKISRYVATKSLVSLATGFLVGVVLVVCQVQLAFMFAVLTILLNFIPNIGSIVATLLPLPVILLQFGFGWQFLVVLVVAGLIQFAVGNVLEPKLMGESMDLHPVAILMFLIFWGLVWGVAGMFLAVPITAILKIILSRIETTKPMAEILAGRLPA